MTPPNPLPQMPVHTFVSWRPQEPDSVLHDIHCATVTGIAASARANETYAASRQAIWNGLSVHAPQFWQQDIRVPSEAHAYEYRNSLA